MILTEATIAELHGELAEKLKAIHGKPLMISITFKDDNGKLQYWMGRNNEFTWEDTEKTVNHCVTQIQKDFKPRNIEVIQDVKRQIHVRKKAKIRG